MNDRDTSPGVFERLRGRFGGTGDATAESSDEPFWKRYGTIFRILVVVGTAFGGAIVGIASTALDRTSSLVRAGGPELLEFLWPVLLGVTAIAVVVCLVVVALGVRNV